MLHLSSRRELRQPHIKMADIFRRRVELSARQSQPEHQHSIDSQWTWLGFFFFFFCLLHLWKSRAKRRLKDFPTLCWHLRLCFPLCANQEGNGVRIFLVEMIKMSLSAAWESESLWRAFTPAQIEYRSSGRQMERKGHNQDRPTRKVLRINLNIRVRKLI